MPDPDVPAPRPLTAEQVAEAKIAWQNTGQQVPTLVNATWVLSLVATVEELQAEVESLRTRLAATTTQRDAAVGLVRGVLEQVSVALGLPLEEAGHPRANSFLFREIGKFIECHEWAWPPDEAAVLDATRDNP